MKKIILLFSAIVITFCVYTCTKPHARTEYMPLVEELHKLECKQLEKHGVKFEMNDTSVYAFRSVAFDVIMTKKPEAMLIAHYEDLCQKLAAMEFEMDDIEKITYKNDFNKEYMNPCN